MQHIVPLEGIVLEESVSCHGVGPVLTGLEDTAGGHDAEALNHLNCPLVVHSVAQVYRLKLLCGPVHARYLLLNSQHNSEAGELCIAIYSDKCSFWVSQVDSYT